ncbi:putative PEP-binding protein [Oscillatoria acuminata]|uniref:Phosphoenolpyruvate synthase n=1 Tax=Oscillatoria acuminata PCC 6304 TaxID=56110 RepID=K9TIX2_9CYAN|nr:putative PEP-binding protein [Oscillatoria acuminata]AFY82772.1 phosphoenolpyruvate synthase/pyruvate phosphate dikinase [Oscillatoria acuminata PCC 6304]
MDHLYWLDQIQPSQRYLVGDNPFYLSQMAQQGYPVLPGFVLAAPALREFLETYPWEEPLFAELLSSSVHLNVDDTRQLKAIAQHIREQMMAAELPQQWINDLAIAAEKLSSPGLILSLSVTLPQNTPSPVKFSGLVESYVCLCDPEEIALGVLQTWAELFRARSLLYWQRSQIELRALNLAVLVQPLHSAITSGTLTYTPAHCEIKATWGLPLSIKLGQAIPDWYQIELEKGNAIAQSLGNKHLGYDLRWNSTPPDELTAETSLLSPYSCLQPYLVSDEQQQEFSLKPRELETLGAIARNLGSHLNRQFSLEWTLVKATEQSPEQIYITGVEVGNPLPSLEMTAPVDPPSSPKSVPVTAIEGEEMPQIILGTGAAKGVAVGLVYCIPSPTEVLEHIPPGRILIAKEIAPHWLHIVRQAAAVVTESGGMTSHAAILAREFGIPAVVGAAGVMQAIATATEICVNGDTGEIFILPAGTVPPSPVRSPQPVATAVSIPEPMPSPDSNPLSSPFPTATQLLVNLSHPSSLDRIADAYLDGVGLLRSEMMALEIFQSEDPYQWCDHHKNQEFIHRISDPLKRVAEFFFPRPVFYRSLDLRGYDLPGMRSPGQTSINSNRSAQTLGVHGAFSYLLDPTLFDLELETLAKLQQEGLTNLRLIIPFVRTVEEFIFCRSRVQQFKLDRVRDFQLWIMAEVPSALFLIPDYVQAGVQGISIGTNDLTQLLLAADRENQQMSQVFDPRHPVVMRAIHQLIQQAKAAGIPCAICGGAPTRYPETIDTLVRWGIDGISVEPEAIVRTHQAIARSEQRILLETARRDSEDCPF